jgi:chemosensory pili system protein ChpA (sensor histidine kinase/response regulator)
MPPHPTTPAPEPEPPEDTHAAQETVRVRSDLLDSLVNYAGEMSICRSRLEQQISTVRFNLAEFDQAVGHLREQLRELETRAGTPSSEHTQNAQPAEGRLDPLELDRFAQVRQLSRALDESVSGLVSIQGSLENQTRQSETLLLQQSRVGSELQDGLMRTRMVPFDSLVPTLRRTLRQAAQELGKRAQLKIDGAHGEMDRTLLERMKAPFEHMLRNALAHGIETPEERLAAGKPAEGTVTIAVSREATEVVLRVADDGRGLNRDAIRRKAIERGLLKPEAQLSDRDLDGFVLESGFTTVEHATQLDGRGIGLDVVNNEVKQLGGSIAIDSTPGVGARFTIRLPFTLAVTQAILVKLGASSYAVPVSAVQGVTCIGRRDLEHRIAAGQPKHMYAGEEYDIYDLAQLLGISATHMSEGRQIPLLMTRTGDQRAAVRVDSVIGSREIVVKSVGPQVSSIPGVFGATIMGDGAVVIILDFAPLVRRLAALRASAGSGFAFVFTDPTRLAALYTQADSGAVEAPAVFLTPQAPAADGRGKAKSLIMVVDDSTTLRKVATHVLERADYEVIAAQDGLDAVEKLRDDVPDLMLIDSEMPRMDGYELATYMRNDARLREVPIVMTTAHGDETHRRRALELGIEHYLDMPYQEDDLLRQVGEALKHAHDQ